MSRTEEVLQCALRESSPVVARLSLLLETRRDLTRSELKRMEAALRKAADQLAGLAK